MKRFLFLFTAIFAGCQHSIPEPEPLVGIQIQDRNGLTETISSTDRLEQYGTLDFFEAQPYKKVVRVYRKEGKNQAKTTTYHPNGALFQYLESKEMRANGAYREWFQNGQQRIDATVIGGTSDLSLGAQQDWLFDGLSKVWDDQGNLLAAIPYQKGALEGVSLYYYPSGQVEKEIPYFKNAIEGEVLEFTPDGLLKSKTKFKRGLKEGVSLGFFQNGKPSWVEDHSNGLLLTGTYYNPKGDKVSDVQNGGGFQAVFENEILALLVEHKYGHPEGTVHKYTPSGDLQTSYQLKKGKKQGEEIEYYLPSERIDPNRKEKQAPKISISWHENAIHGTVKTWYPNGQLQSQRDYCRNQKQGSSVAWYKEGALMMVEEYEADHLIKGQYYKIGQKEPVSSIFNGSGTATLYDEEGFFLRKVQYLKGKILDPET